MLRGSMPMLKGAFWVLAKVEIARESANRIVLALRIILIWFSIEYKSRYYSQTVLCLLLHKPL